MTDAADQVYAPMCPYCRSEMAHPSHPATAWVCPFDESHRLYWEWELMEPLFGRAEHDLLGEPPTCLVLAFGDEHNGYV